MDKKTVARFAVAALIICILGFAAYILVAQPIVDPRATPADGPSLLAPAPSSGDQFAMHPARTLASEVAEAKAPLRVQLVDSETARPLAGLVLTTPSQQAVAAGTDGTAPLQPGQHYRFSSPDYGKGVVLVHELGDGLTIVRIRPLHAVRLTMSAAAVSPVDGVPVTLQFQGQYLPYVNQIGEYSARLRPSETVSLRLPRGRWQIRAASGAKVRPHAIDTFRGAEFELSLVDERRHAIGGLVQTVAGTPCQGATVQVVGRASNVKTDAEGRFLIRDCPPVVSLHVLPNDERLEPTLHAGPFEVGRHDLVLSLQNAHRNSLTVRSRIGALVPDAAKLHSGSLVTDCSITATGVVALPRKLAPGDAVEIHDSSLGAPVFCREWTEECDAAASERRYTVRLAEREVTLRIHDAGTMAPIAGCRVHLLSSPNGLAGGAPSGAAIDFAAGLRKSAVHGAYRTDADGVVALRGVFSDSMYAECRCDGYADARVRLDSERAFVQVALHRTLQVEGRVLVDPKVADWVCSVRLAPADGGTPIEALATQGRFRLDVRSGRYRVGVRLGPSLSQLAPIEREWRDLYASTTIDVDVRDVKPVRLRFTSDPRCVRGPALGDQVTVQGVTGVDPIVRVNNGGGILEPVFVFPGDYYIWISGVADDTGEGIVAGKPIRVLAGAEELFVPLGFTGRKMLLRAEAPAGHPSLAHVRLPDWSYVPLNAEGAAMLAQELPEGSPLQLVENIAGKWVNLGEPMRLILEGDANGYSMGRAVR